MTFSESVAPICLPAAASPEDNRGYFGRMAELRDGVQTRIGRPLPELSMGMTNDFEVAIEEGATLIRVGRALFGERRPVTGAAAP